MTTDPYKVLGVAPTATDDEVKKAYRDLARKYHPDNYANTPLSDLASEKMKEVNEAYDEIQKLRKSGQTSGNGYTDEPYTGSATFADIRELIAIRNFYEADIRLNSVPNGERGAEWYYLKGFIFQARGWYFEASKHFDTACRMEPSNIEYRNAANAIRNYTSQAPQQQQSSSDAVCNLCSGLICADCCCECCGGDLISCC